jgi:dolichol-phosphate mannosyltransferase
MKGLTIIVPTLNEEKNIQSLINRIVHVMAPFKNAYEYELIFVDDHSTDETCHVIRALSSLYPLKLYKKVGKKGKAESILEGCRYAQYDVVAFIDADLQYPPEALPEMIVEMKLSNVDIVVTNRKVQQTNLFRKWGSKINRFIFGRLLFGIPYDTQSGMKIFKKKVIDSIEIAASAWSFDLEFLVRALMANYKVSSIDITFEKRKAGESKVGFMRVAYELILSSMRLRIVTLFESFKSIFRSKPSLAGE